MPRDQDPSACRICPPGDFEPDSVSISYWLGEANPLIRKQTLSSVLDTVMDTWRRKRPGTGWLTVEGVHKLSVIRELVIMGKECLMRSGLCRWP